MTERPFPPLPAPGLTTSVQFGCDGRWWSEAQMRDYVRADRAAQADYAAVLRELVVAASVLDDELEPDDCGGYRLSQRDYFDLSAAVSRFRAATEAARDLLAKENS